MRSGLVAMPLNYRYMAPEIDHALSVGGPRALLAHEVRFADLDATRLAGRLPLGRIGYSDDGDRAPGDVGLAELAGSARGPGPAPPGPDDAAILCFTSGSTGRPKGVCHSFASLGWIVASAAAGFGMGPEDVMLPGGSASHVGGHHLSQMTLARGGRVVLARTFDGVRSCPCCAGNDPPSSGCFPRPSTPWYATTAHAEDFASVRACWSGGDKVSGALEEEFTALTGLAINEDYGMTEVGVPTVTPPEAPRPGSVGPLAPGYRASLRDPGGREVATGEPGRLWIGFPGNMVGYWGDPDATAATVSDGGWTPAT
jgi:acyl-CoA synthetase (AMP-forming)/AMP-acid ligase II